MNIEAMPLSELALVFTKTQRLYTIPLFEIRKVTSPCTSLRFTTLACLNPIADSLVGFSDRLIDLSGSLIDFRSDFKTSPHPSGGHFGEAGVREIVNLHGAVRDRVRGRNGGRWGGEWTGGGQGGGERGGRRGDGGGGSGGENTGECFSI